MSRKLRRTVLAVAILAAIGVFTFSGYEWIRTWQATKTAKLVMPGDKAALARFAPLLDDYNPWIRSAAALAIGRIGTDAQGVTPELLHALKDSSAEVRRDAAWALGQVQAGAPAIPALIEALDDEDQRVRLHAARALMLHGPLAEPAVPKLIARLEDDHVAAMAANALGAIGPPAKASIPHLITALRKEQSLYRMDFAMALGKFGPDAKEAIADLLPLTLDPNPEVREVAIAAMRSIDPAGKGP